MLYSPNPILQQQGLLKKAWVRWGASPEPRRRGSLEHGCVKPSRLCFISTVQHVHRRSPCVSPHPPRMVTLRNWLECQGSDPTGCVPYLMPGQAWRSQKVGVSVLLTCGLSTHQGEPAVPWSSSPGKNTPDPPLSERALLPPHIGGGACT